MVKTVRVIVKIKNKILFLQKTGDSKLPFGWELPGGKKEAGKTLKETATAELEEETGIRVSQTKIQKLNFTKQYEYEIKGKKLQREVFYFLVELDDFPVVKINSTLGADNLPEDNHRDFKWVDFEHIQNLKPISKNSSLDFKKLLFQDLTYKPNHNLSKKKKIKK